MNKTIRDNDIFKELHATIKVIGEDNLVEVLKFARKNTLRITDEQKEGADEIIKEVCLSFNITKDELYGRSRENRRMMALGICSYLMKEKWMLSNTDICLILRKQPPTVVLILSAVTGLNPHYPPDSVFIRKIKEIKIKLKY